MKCSRCGSATSPSSACHCHNSRKTYSTTVRNTVIWSMVGKMRKACGVCWWICLRLPTTSSSCGCVQGSGLQTPPCWSARNGFSSRTPGAACRSLLGLMTVLLAGLMRWSWWESPLQERGSGYVRLSDSLVQQGRLHVDLYFNFEVGVLQAVSAVGHQHEHLSVSTLLLATTLSMYTSVWSFLKGVFLSHYKADQAIPKWKFISVNKKLFSQTLFLSNWTILNSHQPGVRPRFSPPSQHFILSLVFFQPL